MQSNLQKPQQSREPQQPLLPLDGHCNGPLFGPLELKTRSQSSRRSEIYRKKVKQATPAWADLQKIRKVYKQAKKMTKEFGVQYSVDHIVPLRGEFVGGLHVHNNLQIVLHEVNIKKGNSVIDQLKMF